MSQEIKNVVLAGASGNLGPTLLQALLDAKQFNVSVLSRASSKATFPPGVNVIKSDYERASLVQQLRGQDAVVCAFGEAALEAQKPLIDAAVEAGVKRFVPSEFGSNSLEPNALRYLDHSKHHAEVIEHLRSKEGQGNGFSWTAIACGPLFDWCLRCGFLDFDLQKRTAVIWDDGTVRFSNTNIDTVGLAVARALQRADQTANKYLYIASFTITQNELLAALQKATGGAEWTVSRTTTDEKVKFGLERLQQGDFWAALGPLILAAGVYSADSGSNFEPNGLSNELLGLPKEDLQESVEKAVAAGPIDIKISG